MPTNCDIEFENNPSKIVYSGQPMRGTVRLTLSEEKKVRGIYIRITGKAYCHWSAGKNNFYTGREDFINEGIHFVGGSGAEIRLAPGSYNYNFQCNLPPQLPTSVQGDIGHISYTATVVLDIPMWPESTFEVPFTVLKPLDVNADPALQMPAVVEGRNAFFPCGIFCCCLTGAMEITARAPVSGYTPGQTIKLEIHVNNRSYQTISDFEIKLKKTIEYNGKPDGLGFLRSSQKRTENRFIAKEEARGCGANSDEIIRLDFQVPPVPPTDTTSSSVIKVAYYLRISASINGCHRNPVLKLPITIGTSNNGVDRTKQNMPATNPPSYMELLNMTSELKHA